MSSVLGTEKEIPISRPLAAMIEKSLCSWGMWPLWEGEARVIEKSSTSEIIRPLGIDVCRGARYNKKRMEEVGDT